MIGRADEGRFVAVQRHIFQRLVVGIRRQGIDGRRHVRAGDGATFASLHSNANDQAAHAYGTRFSTDCSFLSTSCGATGWLPSCSHATAAAAVPRMEAMTGHFV